MVKLGDRVVVGSHQVPIFVKRIYFIDVKGNECGEFSSITTMLELDWGNLGLSKVALHDEGDVWHKYINLN